jgi:hypothetical protein
LKVGFVVLKTGVLKTGYLSPEHRTVGSSFSHVSLRRNKTELRFGHSTVVRAHVSAAGAKGGRTTKRSADRAAVSRRKST